MRSSQQLIRARGGRQAFYVQLQLGSRHELAHPFTWGKLPPLQIAWQSLAPQVSRALLHLSVAVSHVRLHGPSELHVTFKLLQEFLPVQSMPHEYLAGHERVRFSQLLLPEQVTWHGRPAGQVSSVPTHLFDPEQSM